MTRSQLLAAILIIAASTTAKAESYLVYQFTPDVRIVLSTFIPCKDGKGFQAAAQRIDSASISGCWVTEDPKMIRITWSNKDFSIFEENKFIKTK